MNNRTLPTGFRDLANLTERDLLDAQQVAAAQWEAYIAYHDGARQAAIDDLLTQAEEAREHGDERYRAALLAAVAYVEAPDADDEAAYRRLVPHLCIRTGCADLRSQAGDVECFAHHYEPGGRAFQDEQRARRDGYGY